MEQKPPMPTDPQTLRDLYPPVLERARLKVLPRLDEHCRRFLALSPFVCLGTAGPGGLDVSPRGDAPGFVHVLDDATLALPDWPGNNRLDSLGNLGTHPAVGLLVMIPGVDETLRINGTAEISAAPELLARWNVNGKQPRTALVVTVREAFFHCGKALIRSKLWTGEYAVERSALPPYGQILKDQIATMEESAEQVQASVAEAYRTKLY